MAPNTAFNFHSHRLRLTSDRYAKQKGHRPAEFLGTISAVSALLAILGYAYRVPSFYGFGSYVPMTLHTAIAFIALGVGIFLARSDEGIAAVIASDTAGGIVARRLLPLAIVLPAGLGAFALEAGRRGSFESDFASVMHVDDRDPALPRSDLVDGAPALSFGYWSENITKAFGLRTKSGCAKWPNTSARFSG